MATKYVVAFSGAPRSGKDSIANEFTRQCEQSYYTRVARLQFSLPMRKAVFGMIGEDYDEALYEKIKDMPMPEFDGLSVRKLMINLSERHVKPMYGNKFWVKSALGGVKPTQRLIVISDLGFDEELTHILATYGNKQVCIVDVTRDGTTWEGDSRQSLRHMDYMGPRLELYNNGSIANAAAAVRNHVNRNLGWNLASSALA